MKDKRVHATDVISGKDGPVSVFIAGKGNGFKMPLKRRIRNKRNQMRRKRVEKKIHPGAHTKEETIIYAKGKYGFLPLDPTNLKYKREKKFVREGIIYKHRSELLGEFSEIPTPIASDEKSLQEFYKLLQERDRKIEAISDEEVPMDFQMYELVTGNGHVEMVLDFQWNIFSVSCGGGRKQMKKVKQIAQDLYLYYGVTEEDIKNKTERYSELLCVMSDF